MKKARPSGQDSASSDKLVNYECKKITQSLNYLLRKSDTKTIQKIPLVKLLWGADRYHLRRFGRTVTEDMYVAMENGPVSSMAKDILKRKAGYCLSEECIPYIDQYIKISESGKVTSIHVADVDFLSKTDREALDFAWTKLSALAKNVDAIVDFTHKYPEWLAYKKLLKNSLVQNIDMNMFFEDTKLVEDDPFIMDDGRKQSSKSIFNETSHITALFRN